jgi:hypothetical protein
LIEHIEVHVQLYYVALDGGTLDVSVENLEVVGQRIALTELNGILMPAAEPKRRRVS